MLSTHAALSLGAVLFLSDETNGISLQANIDSGLQSESRGVPKASESGFSLYWAATRVAGSSSRSSASCWPLPVK